LEGGDGLHYNDIVAVEEIEERTEGRLRYTGRGNVGGSPMAEV